MPKPGCGLESDGEKNLARICTHFVHPPISNHGSTPDIYAWALARGVHNLRNKSCERGGGGGGFLIMRINKKGVFQNPWPRPA